MGKLILPASATGLEAVTLPVAPAANIIRWVERPGVGAGTAGGRLNRVGEVACRGMTIGWVVATPVVVNPTAGISPDAWGGLTGEVEAIAGGL